MAQIKTIDTVAGENQIDFKRRYPFVWLKNLGDADVYISDKAGIVAEADGVVLLGAGQAAMLENYDDCVYVLGATTIEAHGQHSADSPFGDTIVAGGGGGGGGTIESLTVTQNGIYTASGGVDGYSPVTVEVPDPPAPVLIEKTITQNGVYDPEDDNADGYSMIDVEVPVVDVIELNANMNRTYTAPAGKAYSPVNVSVPGPSISKLTVAHNNVTYEAGIGAAFNPVEVSIPMNTLNAPSNGVYEIDENTDGWDTVIVDTYEKFEVLYSNSGRSVDNANGLVKSLTTTDYDEFYMTAYYGYSDASAPTGNSAAMFSTRYTMDAMMHKTNVGACGSDNFMWTHANQYDPADEIRGFYNGNHGGYAYPFMHIGVKDRDTQRTTLYHNDTATIATDITLSDSIFNYDELILTFATGTYQSSDYATASAYPVSIIQIGKQLCGFSDATGSYFAYEVTSATQLTLVHYSYYLVDVQGIKNDSMEETVIFTNPSSSSVPATVTLSETYKNFDEICLVGHTADAQFEDMIVTQYYPVKALTREFDIPMNKKISPFLDAENCWMSIHGDTTLVPDTTSPAIILDKIIGINKPVMSTSHELIDVEPLSVTQNGLYVAERGKAYSPVNVNINGKYNVLFFSGAINYSPQTLNDDVSDEQYNELWITGYYLYINNIYNMALWSGRYPTSILFPLIAGSFIYGGGPHNHMWIRPTNGNHFNTELAEYDYPYMYIGIKNEDRTEDILWQSTESSTPSTINLAQSIFDYDEVCFFFVKYDGAAVTSWYYTDEIAVNDIVQGYIDTNVSKYTITSNTSLTTVSEDGFRLYGVYGIKDTSMDKTTLFANSGSTNPSTISLSDDYTNYDELTIISHYTTDGTICTSEYPVKIFGMRDDLNAVDRMCVGTKQNATWMSITTPLSFTVDPPSGSGYTVIIDKIIGIKRRTSVSNPTTVTTLVADQNATYIAPTNTVYDEVTVDVKSDSRMDALYSNYYAGSSGTYLIGSKRLSRSILQYDDVLINTSFLYSGQYFNNQTRIPAKDVGTHIIRPAAWSGNYVTFNFSNDGRFITDYQQQWQWIEAVYGIEVNNMIRTTIFDNTESTNPQTVSLPAGKAFTDYDEFILVALDTTNDYIYSTYIPATEIYVNSTRMAIQTGQSIGLEVVFSDLYTMTVIPNGLLLKKIYGVNYNKVEPIDTKQETVLWTNTDGDSSITLSDDYDNYEELMFYGTATYNNNTYNTNNIVATEIMTVGNKLQPINNFSGGVEYTISSKTSFTSKATAGTFAWNITKVVGINYSDSE